MASPEKLSRYLCEHYLYEVQMLHYLGHRLRSVEDRLLWNALFESFALHARVLKDFYASKGTGNSRKAKEYGVKLEIDNGYNDTITSINEQMAHMSKHRPFGEDAKKLRIAKLSELVAWLDTLHVRFIESCDPNCKAGWNEDLVRGEITYVPVPSATNHVISVSTASSTSSSFTSNPVDSSNNSSKIDTGEIG